MAIDWGFITQGVTTNMSRTTGPECQNYMGNTRRLLEGVVISVMCIWIIQWCRPRLKRIHLPNQQEIERRHSRERLGLMLIMTLIFGIEIGFKFANRSMIFILNPCHIQTMIQIYLLAAKPTKINIALFRLQMNNLNGTLLSFLFPEVDCRRLPFEEATYWIQHAMLYIIPVYILKTEAYQVEELKDYNWPMMGMSISLLYHFTLLNGISIISGINLNHMLCAAESDPFEGPNYRLAAVIHQSLLCPLLNKVTVYAFRNTNSIQRDYGVTIRNHHIEGRRSTASSFAALQDRISDDGGATNSVGTQVRLRRRRPKVSESSNVNSDSLNKVMEQNESSDGGQLGGSSSSTKSPTKRQSTKEQKHRDRNVSLQGVEDHQREKEVEVVVEEQENSGTQESIPLQQSSPTIQSKTSPPEEADETNLTRRKD